MRRSSRATPALDDQGVHSAYAAHGPELFRFALRALGDAHAAQDIVQETFLRAWRAADRYDPGLASLRVWLFAIARNAVIDHHRALESRPGNIPVSADPEETVDAGTDPMEDVLHRWLVEEALRRIGHDHRYVIIETYIRSRPHSEVASELGIPEGTLRSRLFYGLKALRVAMDEMGVTL